jgi:hypothetical protein
MLRDMLMCEICDVTQITALRIVTPCIVVEIYQRFRIKRYPRIPIRIILKMDSSDFSEKSEPQACVDV